MREGKKKRIRKKEASEVRFRIGRGGCCLEICYRDGKGWE